MDLGHDKILAEHLSNIIHADTQMHDKHFDLTVNSIHRQVSAGSLDFGGSEYEPGTFEEITPVKINPDDDYGWWKLSGGVYRCVCNEELSFGSDELGLITLHDHAVNSGIIGQTQILNNSHSNKPVNLIFQVPDYGCNIKENARFAVLHLLTE